LRDIHVAGASKKGDAPFYLPELVPAAGIISDTRNETNWQIELKP
jgi:hypothetical protein